MTCKDLCDKKESAEQAEMKSKLSESDKSEDKDWRIKSDAAAFGRKKIEIPDRW